MDGGDYYHYDGRTEEEKESKKRQKLRSKVLGLCAVQDRLPAAATQRLYPISAEERMAQPTRQIEQWLHVAKPYARQQRLAEKRQEQTGTRDIQQYFEVIRPRSAPGKDNTTKRPP